MYDDEEYYKELREGINNTKKFISSSRNLSTIFKDDFFTALYNKVDALRKNQWENVHPLWNLMLRLEPDNNYVKLKLLDSYISAIAHHPSTGKKEIKYIKKELTSPSKINSLNILFEISIAGLLIKYFDSNKIKLYERTIGNKNVDAVINIAGRPIYLDASVIGESMQDRSTRDQMMRGGISVWSGSRDIPKDVNRVTLKLLDKADQMPKHKPSVLLLAKYDVFPDSNHIKWSIKQNQIPNIGFIMQFNRTELENTYTQGLDKNCSLSNNEERQLTSVFKEKYQALIYR